MNTLPKATELKRFDFTPDQLEQFNPLNQCIIIVSTTAETL